MERPVEPGMLADELIAEREALLRQLDQVAPESLTTPGLLGEWSGRELIAHLGYWVGHAAEVIHAVEAGRTEDLEHEPVVDDVNETVARVARSTDLPTVRRREAASVDALVERLRGLEPALLDVSLPDGASLAQGIREDASEHYRGHGDDLRRALEATPHD
jgi:hypothetical protein